MDEDLTHPEYRPGAFEKRATRVVSNAALYDLVQDLATAVDKLYDEMRLLRQGVDALLHRVKDPHA